MLLMASPAVGMMSPLRIDHHGWQIVLLLAMLFGLVARTRAAGGAMAGLAIAASLDDRGGDAALSGAGRPARGIGWMSMGRDPRVRAFAAALVIGTLSALYGFVSPDALDVSVRCAFVGLCAAALLGARCCLRDLSVAATACDVWRRSLAGRRLVAAAVRDKRGRCHSIPIRRVDPEARRLWLDTVSEALPLYRQGANAALATLVLPLIGLAGAIMHDPAKWRGQAACAAGLLIAALRSFAALAAIQTRAAVTAQAVAAPGAAALLFFGWLASAASGRCWSGCSDGAAVPRRVGPVPRLAINATRRSGHGAIDAACGQRALPRSRAMAALDRLPPCYLLARSMSRRRSWSTPIIARSPALITATAASSPM
jgi:hypothetical protein